MDVGSESPHDNAVQMTRYGIQLGAIVLLGNNAMKRPKVCLSGGERSNYKVILFPAFQTTVLMTAC